MSGIHCEWEIFYGEASHLSMMDSHMLFFFLLPLSPSLLPQWILFVFLRGTRGFKDRGTISCCEEPCPAQALVCCILNRGRGTRTGLAMPSCEISTQISYALPASRDLFQRVEVHIPLALYFPVAESSRCRKGSQFVSARGGFQLLQPA